MYEKVVSTLQNEELIGKEEEKMNYTEAVSLQNQGMREVFHSCTRRHIRVNFIWRSSIRRRRSSKGRTSGRILKCFFKT